MHHGESNHREEILPWSRREGVPHGVVDHTSDLREYGRQHRLPPAGVVGYFPYEPTQGSPSIRSIGRFLNSVSGNRIARTMEHDNQGTPGSPPETYGRTVQWRPVPWPGHGGSLSNRCIEDDKVRRFPASGGNDSGDPRKCVQFPVRIMDVPKTNQEIFDWMRHRMGMHPPPTRAKIQATREG